jgi:hypothetical protein
MSPAFTLPQPNRACHPFCRLNNSIRVSIKNHIYSASYTFFLFLNLCFERSADKTPLTYEQLTNLHLNLDKKIIMKIALLILSLIGTFLLSVEAIKLDNLKKTVKLLKRSNSTLNPKIEINQFTESNSFEIHRISFSIFILIILITFYPISFLILNQIFKSEIKLIWILLFSAMGSFVVWTILVYIIEFIILIYKLIEKYTSQGIIGILGFIILAVSFILQFIESSK